MQITKIQRKRDLQDPFKNIKNDFPIFNQSAENNIIYMDNAATTQKPTAVLDAMSNYYSSCNSNVFRAIHRWGEESTREYEKARRQIAGFINAKESCEVIFTSGTTDGINLVASSFCRKHTSPGDEIILTEMEHHSNIVPWQIASEQYDLSLKYVSVTDRGELDRESLSRLWSKKTKLLALTHMSNVLGTINPVKAIIQEAHSHGIPVLLDGAQSVPHLPVDVQDLDCDFLAFSGHKMCAPTGIGVLYGKKQFLQELPPCKGGGEMIRNVYPDHSEWNSLPHKFEAGTPHIAGAIGLGAAVTYLNRIGMDTIQKKEHELTAILLGGLQDIPGIDIYGKAEKRGGIVCFTREGTHSHDLAQYMDSRGIALRAGHHCAHILARELEAGDFLI
ncbi:MAG: hypothetical protein B6241_15420 [Spirochaetaceae bacterium 4572_59]|nr:MAG: hypothetical protein B6241_15420 [Spirochaetaceae bacterium 4572_59]